MEQRISRTEAINLTEPKKRSYRYHNISLVAEASIAALKEIVAAGALPLLGKDSQKLIKKALELANVEVE